MLMLNVVWMGLSWKDVLGIFVLFGMIVLGMMGLSSLV